MSGKLIIDDTNYHSVLTPPTGLSKGREPRNYALIPHGAMPHGTKFDLPLIPRAEWADRIADQKRNKTRSQDIIKQAGLAPLDQNGTNYCWCNAVVMAVMIVRLRMGLPLVRLSPASVAAIIKGGANQGGWGGEALEFMVDEGVSDQQLWPPNDRSLSYRNKPEVLANRKLHKITEWYDLEPRNFDQLATCLLLGYPVAIGLNWWSHEVCALDLDTDCVDIYNSWGESYGEGGIGHLSYSKATPDDACTPRVITASLT